MPINNPYNVPVDENGNPLPIVPQGQSASQYNNPNALGDISSGTVNYNPYTLGGNPFTNQGGNIGNVSPDSKSPSATNTSQGNASTALAAGNLVGGAIGAYEFFKAKSQLDQLEKTPYPNYSVSSELEKSYNRAEGMANEGYTPSEKAAYQNNINQQGTMAYNRAVGAGGGNLSNVIRAGINSSQVSGENQFSIGDATLRRQNMENAAKAASEIQTQKNMATQQSIALRNMQEQAYGKAMQSGLQSFGNSFNLGGIATTAMNLAPLLA